MRRVVVLGGIVTDRRSTRAPRCLCYFFRGSGCDVHWADYTFQAGPSRFQTVVNAERLVLPPFGSLSTCIPVTTAISP